MSRENSQQQPVSNEPTTVQPKQKRLRGCLVRLMVLGVLLAILVAGAAFGWRKFTENNLSQQVDSLRNAEIPISVEDVEQLYRASLVSELDTSDDWTSAIQSLGTNDYQAAAANHPIVGDQPPPPTPPTTWRNPEATVSFMEPYRSKVADIKLAATGLGIFPMDFANEERLPEATIEKLNDAFRLLQLDCYVQSLEKNPTKLASSIASLLSFSNCVSKHPGHVSEVLHFDSEAYQLLARFIQRVEFDEKSLKQFQSLVERRTYWDLIQAAWNQQRANRFWMYSDLAAFKQSGLSRAMRTEPRWQDFWKNVDLNIKYSPFAAEDAEQFLEYMYLIENLFGGGFWEAKDAVAELEQSIRKTEQGSLEQIRYPTARYMVPTIAPLIEQAAETEAWRQLLLAALATDRSRIASKELPSGIDGLSPEYLGETPMDLYANEPVSLKTQADSVVIYLVGPNRQDNSGGGDDLAIQIYKQKWNPANDGALEVD